MADYKEIDKNIVLKHYSKKEVQEEIVRCSKDKEVVGSYGGHGYAKRPDIIMHPSDVLELVKKGITSFHMSEEIWENPLAIDPMMKKKEIEELKKGWDLILDIDCHFLEYSKFAAHLLVEALKYHSIESVSVKFSGNHGFHIGVPFEAFPEEINDTETRKMFPEAPRRIAAYLKEMIKNPLSEMIMKHENNDFSEIMKKTEKTAEEITRYEYNEMGDKIPKLDSEPFLEIDTILISSRHLLRHVYSFNEKSKLVSIPIKTNQILTFDKKSAIPDNIKDFSTKFLEREKAKEGEANNLFVQAFDFKPQIENEYQQLAEKSKKEYQIPEEAIPEELFPPCIKRILEGLQDGRKRSLFILINFLTCAGWSYEQIEQRLKEWNKCNEEELRETILMGQLRYNKQQKKKILPPNCLNSYYKDLQICSPDNLCKMIKNPIQYSRRKTYYSEKKNNKKKNKAEKKEKDNKSNKSESNNKKDKKQD